MSGDGAKRGGQDHFLELKKDSRKSNGDIAFYVNLDIAASRKKTILIYAL